MITKGYKLWDYSQWLLHFCSLLDLYVHTSYIADLCCLLVTWSVMLLILWFVDPSIHTLEKFLCPDNFISYLWQTTHHNVDTSDIFQDINIAMQPRHRLIIFLVGSLAFVKCLFGHLSLRLLRISSTGSRRPFYEPEHFSNTTPFWWFSFF